MSVSRPVVEVVDLEMRVGARVLFRGLSVVFKRGVITAVLGPSGVGKTTLLGAVAGHLRPSGGAVIVAPYTVVAWAQQNSPILPKRTVLDNVALGAECRGMGELEARKAGEKHLRAVGLEHLVSARAGRLSGGERQRLALARAIASEAAVILVDEPTASLDQGSRATVIQAIRATALEGACVIVATHDPVVAESANATLELAEFAPQVDNQ